MKKLEYDVIEKVYCKNRIPNDEVNHQDNKDWWKGTFHESDEESVAPAMVVHEIAFSGTRPLAVKTIKRDKKSLYKHDMFAAKYKKR
jgi:hypothetical protein